MTHALRTLASNTPAVGMADEPTVAMSSSDGPWLTVGSTLGRYEIRETIGAGGMGQVYAAHDPWLDREVAIKVLHGAAEDAASAATGIAREAQALARLDHPNVVAVHDLGVTDGLVWMVMERVEGQTLRAWLQQAPRPWEEILAVMIAAGEGLEAAHAAGLVHRDFKPDNVMIDAAGRVRVIDFGLARDLAEAAVGEDEMLEGTLGYMAPEQLLGCSVDEAADQFAFCVTLWELLFGRRLFDGPTAPEMIGQVFDADLPSPPAGTRVPRWLTEACARGLAPESTQRLPSLRALLDVLRGGASRPMGERSESGEDRSPRPPARAAAQRGYASAPSSPKGPRGPLPHRVLPGQALYLRVLQGQPQAALRHAQARAPRLRQPALPARRALRRRVDAHRQRHDRPGLLRREQPLDLQ